MFIDHASVRQKQFAASRISSSMPGERVAGCETKIVREHIAVELYENKNSKHGIQLRTYEIIQITYKRILDYEKSSTLKSNMIYVGNDVSVFSKNPENKATFSNSGKTFCQKLGIES